MVGNCRDMLGVLGDYIDGDVKGEMCRQLEAHLAKCPNCRVVVDSTRKTIRFYSGNRAPCIPPTFELHLHALLKACWESKALRKIA